MRQLSKREKLLLIILVVSAVSAVIYYTLFPSSGEIITNSESNISDNSHVSEFNKLYEIAAKYNEYKSKIKYYNSKLSSNNDNITTLIQKWAKEESIDTNIAYTRRTQTNIQNKYTRINTDVKINGAAIQSILRFVNKIESHDSVIFISHLHINRGLKGTDKYDALIKIHTFIKK